MTLLSNIHLPEDIHLYPMLEDLITKLALDYPSYTFTARNESELKYWKVPPQWYRSEHANVDQTKVYINAINVLCDKQKLGTIALSTRYRRTGNELTFELATWRVQNQRGGDKTKTANVSKATQLFKKLFYPMDYKELYLSESNKLQSNYDSILKSLTLPITSGALMCHAVEMTRVQEYMLMVATGKPISPETKSRVEKAFASEPFVAGMERYELSNYMSNKKLIPMIVHDGTYLFKSDWDNLLITVSSFDDVPEKLKNSLGVLCLMSDNELVRDVGFRYSLGRYMVCVEEEKQQVQTK